MNEPEWAIIEGWDELPDDEFHAAKDPSALRFERLREHVSQVSLHALELGWKRFEIRVHDLGCITGPHGRHWTQHVIGRRVDVGTTEPTCSAAPAP